MFSLSGEAKFVAATYRLFKSPQKRQEGSYDITYVGGIPDSQETFQFDLFNKFNVSFTDHKVPGADTW